MNLQFRIANENDIKGIIELCNECFNENRRKPDTKWGC